MSLTWKSQRPRDPGWYWVRDRAGVEKCVEVAKKFSGELVVNTFTPIGVTTFVGWAGPIARPHEPSKQQLATVRYQLSGTYAAPRTHYWGAHPLDWAFVDRAEMLQRVRRHLTGCYHEQTGYEADSTEVTLYTSIKRSGRWVRQPGQSFTAATIDAEIAHWAAARNAVSERPTTAA